MRTTEGGVAWRSQKWLSMNSSPLASHFAFGLPIGVSPFSVSMDRNTQQNQQSRNWNILNWNIHGLNFEDKCNAIKEKIEESSCAVLRIQETKKITLITPSSRNWLQSVSINLSFPLLLVLREVSLLDGTTLSSLARRYITTDLQLQ